MGKDEIEEAVASLIEKGKIDARINSRNKTLVAKEVPNHRVETLKKVKNLGDTFMAETHSMILRKCFFSDLSAFGSFILLHGISHQ